MRRRGRVVRVGAASVLASLAVLLLLAMVLSCWREVGWTSPQRQVALVAGCIEFQEGTPRRPRARAGWYQREALPPNPSVSRWDWCGHAIHRETHYFPDERGKY